MKLLVAHRISSVRYEVIHSFAVIIRCGLFPGMIFQVKCRNMPCLITKRSLYHHIGLDPLASPIQGHVCLQISRSAPALPCVWYPGPSPHLLQPEDQLESHQGQCEATLDVRKLAKFMINKWHERLDLHQDWSRERWSHHSHIAGHIAQWACLMRPLRSYMPVTTEAETHQP